MTLPVEWFFPLLLIAFTAGGYAWSIVQTRAALKRAFRRIEVSEAIIMVNVSMGKLTMPTGIDLSGDE